MTTANYNSAGCTRRRDSATPIARRALLSLSSLAAALLCTPAWGGSQPLNLGGVTLVADTNQPSFVQHAVRELQSYLGEITGTLPPVSASLPSGSQPAVLIGLVSAAQRLPELTVATLGEEGFVIKSSTQDGRDCLVVSGATAKGTKFGIYALMKMIRPRGRMAWVEEPVDVVSKPAFALRGMHLNGWSINYPYSFRRWPEADWHRYIDLLSCQGVNLLYIWPFMEIIPVPVSPPDEAYLAEFRRIVDYAQREHGMEVWMMQSPNRVAKSNCGVADPRNRPYWRPEHQVDMNPADPEQFQEILASRKALYRIVNNVDGVCTIDCDPGGWPGAPLSDWAKIFNGCRSLLDEYNVHRSRAKQIAWLHLGWGRTTPVRLDYPMGDIIKGLEQDCRGPLLYIAGWPALIQMCQDAGVIRRTVALPYSTIEAEPSYPTTRVSMSGVSNVLQTLHRFPEAAGAMGNAQCPLIQFPHAHYFLSGLWDQGYLDRSRETVLKDVSAQLYPENAQFVADCFAALKSTNPGQINGLADRLQKLIKEDRLGQPGVYGRKLFPNPSFVADSLLMQLRLRAAEQRLFQACGGSPTANELRQLLTIAFDSYLTWDKAHGWHDLWGTGWPQNENPIFGDRRLPRLVACLRSAAGGNKSVEALLSEVAQTLSTNHAESQVRTYCTEPMKRLVRMPEPVRSLAQKSTATASVVPKPERVPCPLCG